MEYHSEVKNFFLMKIALLDRDYLKIVTKWIYFRIMFTNFIIGYFHHTNFINSIVWVLGWSLFFSNLFYAFIWVYLLYPLFKN